MTRSGVPENDILHTKVANRWLDHYCTTLCYLFHLTFVGKIMGKTSWCDNWRHSWRFLWRSQLSTVMANIIEGRLERGLPLQRNLARHAVLGHGIRPTEEKICDSEWRSNYVTGLRKRQNMLRRTCHLITRNATFTNIGKLCNYWF